MTLSVAGWVVLVGGALLLVASLGLRREGEVAWRGSALSAAGFAAYGTLIVSGVYPDRPMASAGLWFVVVLVWAGLILSIRDRRKARQAR
jgi:hypothetical protein